MACTVAVARRGQQRSSTRIFQAHAATAEWWRHSGNFATHSRRVADPVLRCL